MKKLLIFGVLVVLVGIVTLRAYRNEPATSNTPTPSSQRERYTLAVISSDVFIKNTTATEFLMVSGSIDVSEGTEVKTSGSGRAQLQYPNGTITGIEENSQIKIVALSESGNKSRLEIMVGGILSKIVNSLSSSDYYEVQTENVVASVRGTIFSTSFRDGNTQIVGIEDTVRVRARDPKLKQIIEGATADIRSGEKTIVRSDKLPGIGKALVVLALADDDYRTQGLKRNVVRHLNERDTSGNQVKTFVQKLYEKNSSDAPFIRDLINGGLYTPGTSSTPSVSSRTPTLSATISTRPTVLATSTPAPATPTPTPNTSPVLESVFPKSVTIGQKFTLNGQYFTVGRNTPQITSIEVGGVPAQFTILDSLTIFVYAPNVLGLQDVRATTTAGTKITLPKALTVQ